MNKESYLDELKKQGYAFQDITLAMSKTPAGRLFEAVVKSDKSEKGYECRRLNWPEAEEYYINHLRGLNNMVTHNLQPSEIKVKAIKLLSIEEAEKVPEEVRKLNTFFGHWWWLRTPGSESRKAACVYYDGVINPEGYDVNYIDVYYEDTAGVRPAIEISNCKELGLKEGDIIKLAGHKWTIIPDEMALCNDVIQGYPFKDYDDRLNYKYIDERDESIFDGFNDYEKSDVKKFIEEWAYRNGILTTQYSPTILIKAAPSSLGLINSMESKHFPTREAAYNAMKSEVLEVCKETYDAKIEDDIFDLANGGQITLNDEGAKAFSSRNESMVYWKLENALENYDYYLKHAEA